MARTRTHLKVAIAVALAGTAAAVLPPQTTRAVDGATITIVQDTSPDSKLDFRFGGGLGPFQLDDPTTDDGDTVANSATFDVDAGNLRIRQQQFGNWDLTAIDCTPLRVAPVVKLDKGVLLLDLESGENVTCRFANQRKAVQTGTINVRVGDDTDGDGRFDIGEPWLAGWTVQLFDRDGYPRAERQTDVDGRVSYDAEPGDYTVCEVLQSGWTSTRPSTIGTTFSQPCLDVTVGSNDTIWTRFFNSRVGPTDGGSFRSSVSADGTLVVFDSNATNLVDADTNDVRDVFLFDTTTKTTTLVSVGIDGSPANNNSSDPAISPDGTHVVFTSTASNLIQGDTNFTNDVFLYEIATGMTSRVNVNPSGRQSSGPAWLAEISADGSRISYASGARDLVPGDTDGLDHIYLYDAATGETARISQLDRERGGSQISTISADGTRIAYSQSTDHPGTSTTQRTNIILHDTVDGSTRVIDVDNGTQRTRTSETPSISADGNRVAYSSSSSSLVADDTNGRRDIFVYDDTDGSTTRVNLDAAGNQLNRISEFARISGDGQRIAYRTRDAGVVTGDTNDLTDVFVFDTTTATTTRVSVATGGAEADEESLHSSLSGDGTRITFRSSATTLVDDSGRFEDIYLRDTVAQTTIRVSSAAQ